MSSKCIQCNKVVTSEEDVIKCCQCHHVFHPECCSLKTVQNIQKLGTKKTSWQCDSCKHKLASSSNRQGQGAKSSAGEEDNIMGVLLAMRKDMSENMNESRERFDGLEASIKSMKDVLSDLNERINNMEEDNRQTKSNVMKVREDTELNTEEIHHLRRRVMELEQYSRRNNVEIKGIPFSTNENINVIVEATARALGVSYSGADFSIVHRLPQPKSGHPTIIAAFVSRMTREMWLRAAKEKKISTTLLSPHLQPGPVYINCHLTGHNKQLLGQAKRLVRERKLVAAWTVEGKVLVRKEERGHVTRVWFNEELEQLTSKD